MVLTPVPSHFTIPQQDRSRVTGEPEPCGTHHDAYAPDVSWIGHAQEGGGHVPEDYAWTTNPKQEQDVRMGELPEEAPGGQPG